MINKNIDFVKQFLLAAFFLSGATALMYEILWMKQLTLVFGVSLYAVSVALAIFFTGLALGSFLFGQLSDRFKKTLLLYAFLELSIGVYAIFTPLLFNFVEYIQILISGAGSISPFLWNLIRFFLSFMVLIVPATLIGGTLPVIIKYFAKNIESIGSTTARLYSINTFGGVFGVVIAGFFLIQSFGIMGTTYIAAFINIAIGAAVLYISKKIHHTTTSVEEVVGPKPALGGMKYFSLIPVVFFFSGFAALLLEVLWTRVLILTIGISTYAFSIVLATFLLGIALGSLIVKHYIDKISAWNSFGFIEILRGIFTIAIIPFFGILPLIYLKLITHFGWSFNIGMTLSFAITMLVLLLPTLLMGATFPIVAKIATKDQRFIGLSVGRVYAFNTCGGVFGSLTAGFILIPLLGVQSSMFVAAIIYLFIGAVVTLHSKTLTRTSKHLVILVASLTFFVGILLPDWNEAMLQSEVYAKAPSYIESSTDLFKDNLKFSETLFYKEGLISLVSVQETYGQRVLKIDGKVQSGSTGDRESQLLLGHLPILFNSNPQSALIIGLGSGMTLGAVEQHKELSRIVVVEIEKEVFEAASYFNTYNNYALEDSRLESVVSDGRNYLLTTSEKFDIITSEPSNPWIRGMANLYTKEYFELAKDHLKENGIMAVWMQLGGIATNDLKSFLFTFKSVFEDVYVFETGNSIVLLGGKNIEKNSFDTFRNRVNNDLVLSNLGKMDVYSSYDLVRYFVFGNAGIENFTKGNLREHTDNNSFLEYASPKSYYKNKDILRQNKDILLPERETGGQLFSELSFYDEAELNISFNARSFYLAGKSAFEDSNLLQAVKLLENGLSINKQYTPLNNILKLTYGVLGSEYQIQGIYDVSEKYYKKLTENFPEESLGWSDLGYLYASQKKYDDALLAFDTALTLNPSDAEVYVYKGSVLREVGKFDESIKVLIRALELEPKSITALNNLGLTYLRSGRNESALKYFTASIKIEPNQSEIQSFITMIENE